jgi:hypothetical protein
MTDGTSQPMVFGDIHELLRKVNGESEPAYMWQSDKPKEEVRQEERTSVPEPNETPPLTHPEPVKEQDAEKNSPKPKPRKEKAKPPPSRDEQKEDEKVVERPKEKKKVSTIQSSSPSKEAIQSQIDSFSYANERGRRHWVYLPDEVFATFETVYGCNRLSAILTALARAFIETNKEELRRLVTHRSGLFQ